MPNLFSPDRFAVTGMTLVEAVVAVGIYTLLMLVITTTVVELYQSNSYTMAQANEVDTARRGLLAWTQDAREMLSSAEGTWPISIMESQRMGFYSDIDRDDDIEYVIYQLASTTLYRYTYEPTGSPPTYSTTSPSATYRLSEYVQNLIQGTSTFRYFDTNGVELFPGALLTDVRYVETQLIVNIDPIREPGEFMLRASVAPRNLKDNL
jgi:type II secretory pathway component PulJ